MKYMNCLICMLMIFAGWGCSDDTIQENKEPMVATDGGYLFAHMTDENYARLFYSVSRDAFHWETLNKKRIDLPDYVRILYYNDYMGDESIGRAAIEKIELAWQADPSKFRVDKKQNRLIYSYPPDGPWYELKYIADELPNSLEAEISGGNQLIMNYEQAQELFGIKFRRWLGIFNL